MPARARHLDTHVTTPPDDGEHAAAPRRRRLVLVIDDDAGLRMLVRTTLSAAGFDVHEAADGESALREFRHHRPDLVLCDVVMPGIDGFEVCARLRAMPGCTNLPIVMLTALDDTRSIGEAFSRGASAFIVKPIVWPLLPHRLRYLMRAGQALDALQASEERYALAAGGANDGLWDWDLRRGSVYYSPRWKQMLGHAEGDIGNSPDEWLRRVHADDLPRLRAQLDAHLRGDSEHFQSEHRMRAADGSERWMMVRGLAVRDSSGKATRVAGSQTDITERKTVEARLLHDAFHDTLTGLANRTLFLDRMRHCIDIAQRRPTFRFAVLFMDLDRFKVINDSLGHLQGDRLLVTIAERLRGCLRAGDTLARLGGDEFTFLFEELDDASDATRMAERIQDALALPVPLGEQRVVMSASMGIALSTTGYERAEDMLRDADAAMYRAKERGRGCFELFDTEMHARAVHALEVESALRLALERSEFLLRYQPISALTDAGEVVGFEALLRWQDPERGERLPEEFLQVACETRLIVPIGRQVLRRACAQMAQWRARWPHARHWFVSVNLSSQELAQPDLVECVVDTLQRSGLPAANLRLEVTEGSLIANHEHSLAVMQALRAAGVQLSIDDFGTGFSSLNYLHRYPFDTLKIDRAFVRGLEHDGQSRGIVAAVIALARHLGMEVVAEGSETDATLTALRAMQCQFVQGWCIAAALVPEEVGTFIARRDGHSHV